MLTRLHRLSLVLTPLAALMLQLALAAGAAAGTGGGDFPRR